MDALKSIRFKDYLPDCSKPIDNIYALASFIIESADSRSESEGVFYYDFRPIDVMSIPYEDLDLFVLIYNMLNKRDINFKEEKFFLVEKMHLFPNLKKYQKNKIVTLAPKLDRVLYNEPIENILMIIGRHAKLLNGVLWPDFYQSGDGIEEETIDKDCIATSKTILRLFSNQQMLDEIKELDSTRLIPLFNKHKLVKVNMEGILDVMPGLHLFTLIQVDKEIYLIQAYSGKIGFTYTRYKSFEYFLDLLKEVYFERNRETFSSLFLVPSEKSLYPFLPHISFEFYSFQLPNRLEVEAMIKWGTKLLPIWE